MPPHPRPTSCNGRVPHRTSAWLPESRKLAWIWAAVPTTPPVCRNLRQNRSADNPLKLMALHWRSDQFPPGWDLRPGLFKAADTPQSVRQCRISQSYTTVPFDRSARWTPAGHICQTIYFNLVASFRLHLDRPAVFTSLVKHQTPY